jgi:predicted Zn-dependent protease
MPPLYGFTEPLVTPEGYIITTRAYFTKYRLGVIVSTFLLKKFSDQKYRLRLLLTHELGHFYGLAAASNVNRDFTTNHCKSKNCVMNPLALTGWKTDRLLSFCDPDLKALKRNLRMIYA